MKKFIFIVMMLFSLGVNAQTMEKDYVNYLLDKEKVQDKRTQLFTNTKRVIVRRNRLVFVFDRKNWVDKGLNGFF
jgi:thioredoxin-related protein